MLSAPELGKAAKIFEQIEKQVLEIYYVASDSAQTNQKRVERQQSEDPSKFSRKELGTSTNHFG